MPQNQGELDATLLIERTRIYADMRTYTHTCAHICLHTRTYADMRAYTQKCLHICSRVPRQLLDSSEYAWDILAHGRWRRSEHITLGEGRGALHLLDGLARDPSAHGFVVLSLMDNEPWAHASSKGRSPTFRLNRLLQRKASLTAITDIEFLQPWAFGHSSAHARAKVLAQNAS